MSGSQHHQSIKGSHFGNHTTVCLVHNDFAGKRKGTKRHRGHRFLDQLSPSVPLCPLQHGSFAAPSGARELFGPVLNSHDFYEWQTGMRGPALVIQDPTSTWHCTLFREAQAHLGQSGLVGSYLHPHNPDSPDADANVTTGDVLRGVMRTLLVQCPKALASVRRKYRRRVGPTAAMDPLQDIFKHAIACVAKESNGPIYIIIRGVFQIPDELAALLACRDARIQWLLMLPWSSIPAKLKRAAPTISVQGRQVARSAGLGHVVDCIQRFGSYFQQQHATVKEQGSNAGLSAADFAWFRYTSAGRLLLLPIHAKTVVSYRYLRGGRQRFLVSFADSLMAAGPDSGPDSGPRQFLYLDDTVLNGSADDDNHELVLAIQLALFAQLITRASPCHDDAAEKVATMLMFALEHNDVLIPELSSAVEGDASVLEQAQRLVEIIQGTAHFSRAFVRQAAASLAGAQRMDILVNARQRDADPAFLARHIGRLGSTFSLLVSRPCNDLSDQPSRPTRYDGRSYCVNHVNPDSERREFVDSLSSDSILAQRRPSQSALDGTNTWLWDDAVYKTWIARGGVLWIAGKPGSGKSVLARTISDRFQEANPGEQWCVPTWFCKEQQAGRPDEYLLMLRSILWQTLSAHQAGFDAVTAESRKIYNQHGDHPQWETVDWKMDHLVKMLRLLGRCPSVPNCVWVIDALDEPDGYASGQTHLAAVAAALIGTSACSMCRIRIIVLSRPGFAIKQAFEGCRYIDMNERNRQDVKVLVGDRLGQLRTTWSNVHHHKASRSRAVLSPEDELHLRQIGDLVSKNALGIMLWAVLVFQQLLHMVGQDFSIGRLRDKAIELPPGLEKLYESILRQIKAIQPDGQLRADARIVFQWIIGTSEWGRFRLCDLGEALAIPPEPRKQHQSGWRDVIEENLPRHSMEAYVYRWCGPLVEVVSPQAKDRSDRTTGKVPRTNADWIVQLNHRATRSWLQKRFSDLQSGPAKNYATTKLHEYVDVVLPMPSEVPSPSSVGTERIPAIIDCLGRRHLLKFAFRHLRSCDKANMQWFKSRLPSSALAAQQSWPMQYLRSRFSSTASSPVGRDVNTRILDELVNYAWISSSAESAALETVIEFLLAYSAFIRQATRPRHMSPMDAVMMMIKRCMRLQNRAEAGHQCCLCYLGKIMAAKTESDPRTMRAELIPRSGYSDWAKHATELKSKCLRDYDGNSDHEITKLLLIPSMRIPSRGRKGP